MEIHEILLTGDKMVKQYPLFFRFLKEEGLFDDWLKNRKNFKKEASQWDDYPYSVRGLNALTPKYILLYCQTSFSWARTPQGSCFWGEIDEKWRRYLRRNTLKSPIKARCEAK